MDLTKIVAIVGSPDLYKIVGTTKNGVIVEGLVDKKRFSTFASHKMNILEEISIYTDDESIPLKEVLKKIYEKENKKETINHKSDNETIKKYFLEILPSYDKDKVYVSDMKKILKWYNILTQTGVVDFSETEKEEKKKEDGKETKKEKKNIDKIENNSKLKKEKPQADKKRGNTNLRKEKNR